MKKLAITKNIGTAYKVAKAPKKSRSFLGGPCVRGAETDVNGANLDLFSTKIQPDVNTRAPAQKYRK